LNQTMATFVKKSAAEADWHADSDDEEVEKTWHDVQSPVPGREEEQEVIEEDDSDDDSSDEEEEEENAPLQNQGKEDTAPKPVSKPIVVANLSKKEREALKKKELDDLDSLLAEVGVDIVKPTPEPSAGEEKKKKAKKPKAAAAPEDAAPPVAVEVVKGDAAKALLAAKLQAKNSISGKTQSAAEKAALAEKEKEKASKLAKKKAKEAKIAGFDR
jgi:hypothetical protein